MSESLDGGQRQNSGAHTLAEIVSQPDCWSQCFNELRKTSALERIRRHFAGPAEWLFVGCGSSYYVALSAAATMNSMGGARAKAVPASELLLYPDLVLGGLADFVPVVISRSGRTSEVLRAAQLLQARDIPTIAITCAADQPLETLAAEVICLTPADEKSTVMTRSFTSMLLALQDLAACMSGNAAFSNSLHSVPAAAAPALEAMRPQVEQFVSAHRFSDYVCLGQGVFYGLACESTLKLTEMSVSYAQSFHTLEFRHGPKSIVSPETLVLFLLSDEGGDAEIEVLEEVKELGGTTVSVVNRATARVRAVSDLALELSLNAPETCRAAAYMFAGQLMGFYTGLHKGCDPDHPRHLTRMVVLDGK